MRTRLHLYMSRGFTLLEVLIALAILAVGMLGVIAALVEGLRASRDAWLRGGAVILAADLADSVRANPSAAAAYALTDGAVLDAPAVLCTSAGECTEAEIASADLYQWQQRVLATLPAAVTAVTITPVAGVPASRCTIAIRWTQPGENLPSSFALTVQT